MRARRMEGVVRAELKNISRASVNRLCYWCSRDRGKKIRSYSRNEMDGVPNACEKDGRSYRGVRERRGRYYVGGRRTKEVGCAAKKKVLTRGLTPYKHVFSGARGGKGLNK